MLKNWLLKTVLLAFCVSCNFELVYGNLVDTAIDLGWQSRLDAQCMEYDCDEWIKNRNGEYSDSIRKILPGFAKDIAQKRGIFRGRTKNAIIEFDAKPQDVRGGYTLSHLTTLLVANVAYDRFCGTFQSIKKTAEKIFSVSTYRTYRSINALSLADLSKKDQETRTFFENMLGSMTVEQSVIRDAEIYMRLPGTSECIDELKAEKSIAPGVVHNASRRTLEFKANIGGIMTQISYNTISKIFKDFNDNKLTYNPLTGKYTYESTANPPMTGLQNFTVIIGSEEQRRIEAAQNGICWFISAMHALSSISDFCELIRKMAMLESERCDLLKIATPVKEIFELTRSGVKDNLSLTRKYMKDLATAFESLPKTETILLSQEGEVLRQLIDALKNAKGSDSAILITKLMEYLRKQAESLEILEYFDRICTLKLEVFSTMDLPKFKFVQNGETLFDHPLEKGEVITELCENVFVTDNVDDANNLTYANGHNSCVQEMTFTRTRQTFDALGRILSESTETIKDRPLSQRFTAYPNIVSLFSKELTSAPLKSKLINGKLYRLKAIQLSADHHGTSDVLGPDGRWRAIDNAKITSGKTDVSKGNYIGVLFYQIAE